MLENGPVIAVELLVFFAIDPTTEVAIWKSMPLCKRSQKRFTFNRGKSCSQ